MAPTQGESGTKFDAYAGNYTALHEQSIRASGEAPRYFAEYKLGCLERLLPGFDGPVLDYGCGVGAVLELLAQRYPRVHGFDPSAESLEQARVRAPTAVLHSTVDDIPDGEFGLVVMAGVLHHVPRPERTDVIEKAAGKLKSGGRLVVFEHNPINPLTRRAVANCAFDDDAVLLWPRELSRLLRRSLKDVRTRYIVFFPRRLAALRWIEPHLWWLPAGAQTMVVGTRP